VADDSWAVRHVLQYGPDAEILAPPELREVVRERLSATSR
jgi:predicted DNA-binding transcriptional regulator YafY